MIFLILVNQFQVALGVRLNYFQRDFGNAIQVADEAHRVAFWHQLVDVFMPAGVSILIVSLMIEFYVAPNFVLQWRRWMTASYTSRWLLNSMHYKLALGGQVADNPDQRIAQDIGSLHQRRRHRRRQLWQHRHLQFLDFDDFVGDQSRRVLDHPVEYSTTDERPCSASTFPACCSGCATLYAVFATGVMQSIGRRLTALYFKQQAVEANFRFDLARVREYGEQIALLKGEEREIDRSRRACSKTSSPRSSASSGCARG